VGGEGGNAVTPALPDGGSDWSAQNGRAADALSRDFDRFWHAYGKNVAKLEARKAWDEVNPDAALVGQILVAIERQKQSEQWKQGIQPNAATWLRGQRWNDELPSRGPARRTETVDERLERLRKERQ